MKKQLNTLEVFCIASGSMISSGLFVLPAIVYVSGGPSIILAYLIAALMVVPAMFAKVELATAMPKSGGTYFFVNRSLGPLFGTFAGFASWFSLSLKSSFALVGIGLFIQPLLAGLTPNIAKLIAIGFTLFFMALNIISVKHSGRFQVIFVITLIAILAVYIVTGGRHIQIGRYEPFFPKGSLSLFAIAGTIFISFGGLTKVASIAEEIENPTKTIPAAMFSAFITVTLLYVLVVFITIGILDGKILAQTLFPISLGAEAIAGQFGYIALSGAALLAFITTGNAGLLASSRNPLAMAKDNLLPAFFSKVSVKRETPVMSIISTAVFMILSIIFLDLEKLVKVASTMKLILFAFDIASVILMRMSRISTYKPKFSSPLFPYIQFAGIGIYIFLIIFMGKIPLIITGGFFAVSILWYFLYSGSRNKKDSALIHIVERITNKSIKTDSISRELRDILIERDNIIEDRFDRCMKNAEIIDLPDEINTISQLFSIAGSRLSEKLEVPENEIVNLLKEREHESTTVIQEGLAIPHIVCKGTKTFEILVLRSKKGVIFSQGSPGVHIIFVLAGTKEERNFHLQALMAIAQIVQNRDFTKNWLKVDTVEDLRNLILIADRIRKGEV